MTEFNMERIINYVDINLELIAFDNTSAHVQCVYLQLYPESTRQNDNHTATVVIKRAELDRLKREKNIEVKNWNSINMLDLSSGRQQKWKINHDSTRFNNPPEEPMYIFDLIPV